MKPMDDSREAISTIKSRSRLMHAMEPTVALLCLVVAFHLAYTLALGAFFPTVLSASTIALMVLLGGFNLFRSVWLMLSRSTRRNGLINAAITLVVLALVVGLTKPFTTIAIKRDIGARTQHWAKELLQRPRAEVLSATTGTDPQDQPVRDELVPAFLKRGYFRGVRREEPDGYANEPYLVITYGGGRLGVSGYYLGRPTLRIPENEDVRQVTPGVYTFRVMG